MNWLEKIFDSLVSRVGDQRTLAGIEHDSGLLVSGYVGLYEEMQEIETAAPERKPEQAAVLYADIDNYARLAELDEEGTHRRLVEAIRTMMSYIADNNGRIVHLDGDAILAEFKGADSALCCAINVQLTMRKMNAGLAADQQVLFRIGVNFGDVVSANGNTYGNAVDLAARLEELACTGGICVSESVQHQLDHHSDFRFFDMGERYLGNRSEPMHAFWIEIDSQKIVDPKFTNAVKINALSP